MSKLTNSELVGRVIVILIIEGEHYCLRPGDSKSIILVGWTDGCNIGIIGHAQNVSTRIIQ